MFPATITASQDDALAQGAKAPTKDIGHDSDDGGRGAMRLRPPWGCSLRVPAVAVLVLLAAAAGAILVAADLAPASWVVRIALLSHSGLRRHQRHIGERHLVLAGIRIDLMALHDGHRRLLFRRYDLDPHQLRGDSLAQMRDHRLEQ